jgi:hypothetical protein
MVTSYITVNAEIYCGEIALVVSLFAEVTISVAILIAVLTYIVTIDVYTVISRYALTALIAPAYFLTVVTRKERAIAVVIVADIHTAFHTL